MALNKTEAELKEIAKELASTWGAECYNIGICEDEGIVRFNCVECGEYFYTELSFEEIAKRGEK